MTDPRQRYEFIQSELLFAQKCLRDAHLELAHQNVARAKEFLDAARRAHDGALHQLPQLPPESAGSLVVLALSLADDLRQVQKEIQKYLNE